MRERSLRSRKGAARAVIYLGNSGSVSFDRGIPGAIEIQPPVTNDDISASGDAACRGAAISDVSPEFASIDRYVPAPLLYVIFAPSIGQH